MHLETWEIKQLVRERRRTHGGFCGSCEAIARWLFREHNIVTSTSWIASVLSESTEINARLAAITSPVSAPGR